MADSGMSIDDRRYTCPNCQQENIVHNGVKGSKEGVKYDQDKLRWDLFPAESAEQIIKVLMFGATKYDAWNWAKGIKFTRLFAAMMRHMWAWFRGQTNDPETGLNHLAHAGCCLVFLLSYSQRKDYLEKFDDRPTYYQQEGWFTKTEGGWVEVLSNDLEKAVKEQDKEID